MLRYAVLGCFALISAVILYQSGTAGAADLFIKRSDSQTQNADNGSGKDRKEKDVKNERQLFNRGGTYSGQIAPLMMVPGLQKNTKRIEDFKMPASWGLLDESSKKIKQAETERVIREQRQRESEIAQHNTKADQDNNVRMAKQRADEKTAANRKPGQDPKSVPKEEVPGGSKTKKKDDKSIKGTVIKRAKDPDKGKPRKLFNSR